MERLSSRQQVILDYIQKYVQDHSYPPSVRDIQVGCLLSSTSVVDYNLRILQREGYLRRSPDLSRGLELIGEASKAPDTPFVDVPVIGYISAGSPLPIPDDAEAFDSVQVLKKQVRGDHARLYALQVRGLSMIDDLIDDGDIVVLAPVEFVQDGVMVAARLELEQETTLKRLYQEGDKIRLQPSNQGMKPIITPADNVSIHGTVVHIMRNPN